MAVNKFPRRINIPWIIGILTVQPLIPTWAANPASADEQWHCVPNASGQGWDCNVNNRAPAPIKRAPRPTQAITEPSQETTAATDTQPVTTEDTVQQVASTPSSPPPDGVNNLDWVPRYQLDPRQLAAVPAHCTGAYIEPDREGKAFSGDMSLAPIFATADTYRSVEGGTATFTGNVLVRQGYRQLQSDLAFLYRDTETAEFEGNVVFREPNLLLVGDQASVNMQSGRFDASNVRYVFHDQHARGDADQITRREDELVVLHDATYTTCPPTEDTWTVTGNNVTLNKFTGFGTATNATIRVKGIPVFYTPYIYFPIDDRRQSGFLPPTLGYSDDNGVDITTPYYFNLAPNYDATLYPRIMSERGLLLEGQFRYLTESSRGELGGSYLNDDKLKDGNRNYSEERWLFDWTHHQALQPRWTADVDYNRASDRDYLRDFGTSLDVTATDNLNQQFVTTYNGGSDNHFWSLKGAVQKYQNMTSDASDSYEKVPQIELKGNWLAKNNGFEVDYIADNTYFTRDKRWNYKTKVREGEFDREHEIDRPVYGEGNSEITNAHGNRTYLETGAKYKFEWPYAFITPGLKLKHVQYHLSNLDSEDYRPNDPKYNTSPSTTVPIYSLDAGLFFDRKTNLFGSTEYTQTLEPRMLYLYSPEEKDQLENPVFDTGNNSFSYAQLWRDNRFSGYDRLADMNQLSVGLTTRFLEKNGFERFRAGIGQIFYFEDRKVQLDPYYSELLGGTPDSDVNLNESQRRYLDSQKASTSPIATELVWNATDALSLRQDWIWNTNENHNQEYSLSMRYSPDYDRVFNVSYRYLDQVDRTRKNALGNVIPGEFADGDIEQTDMSFIWPVVSNWSALGRWNYDITNSRSLEAMFGAEYDNCCYKIRFVNRYWIDGDEDIDNAEADRGIFVQFVMKGFGNLFGNKVDDFLGGIDGYREREDREDF